MTESILLVPASGLPIQFDGEEVAAAEASYDGRGFRLTMYTTTDDRLVVNVLYITAFKHESQLSVVYVADSQRQLADKLLAHDPLTFFIGYPSGAQFEARQAKVKQSLHDRYAKLVSEFIAGHLPEAREPLPQ
jgi:hypothetical protein